MKKYVIVFYKLSDAAFVTEEVSADNVIVDSNTARFMVKEPDGVSYLTKFYTQVETIEKIG